MTKLSEAMPFEVASLSLMRGKVYLVPKEEVSGMVVKPEEKDPQKFYIFLGLSTCEERSVGVIINSRINSHIPSEKKDLHMPLRKEDGHHFLEHDSFVDCSTLCIVSTRKLLTCNHKHTLDSTTTEIIIKTIRSSKFARPAILKEYGLDV